MALWRLALRWSAPFSCRTRALRPPRPQGPGPFLPPWLRWTSYFSFTIWSVEGLHSSFLPADKRPAVPIPGALSDDDSCSQRCADRLHKLSQNNTRTSKTCFRFMNTISPILSFNSNNNAPYRKIV